MNEEIVKKLTGKKIKQFRNALKMTQFALSEKIEINQRQVALIEAGKSFPSLSTLTKLAKVFGCSIGNFFDNGDCRSEEEIKEELKNIIDDLNYNKVQTLYAIAKDIKIIM